MVINHNWINSVKWIRFLVLWSVMAYQVNATIAVNVFTREGGMSGSNASNPFIYIQNTGSEVLSNFVYYYYFQTESSQVPILEKYYLPSCETVVLEPVASGYRLKYTVTGANLSPGGIYPNSGGNSVGLHYNGWTAWDKTNDFSNNFSSTFQANNKIAVYIGGTRIFGSEPDTASTPPLSPDSLNLTAISWQRIDLSWVDNSSNESGFRIERAIGSDSFIEIGTTAANFTTYQSTGLTASTSYTYRVRAYNIAGNSDYCTSVSATTHSGPEGYISRDMWTGVTGITVSSIPLSNTPDISNTINILETASNYGDNYGQRIRGYITAPSNGQYTFWISSDNNSELWLSTNNQPSNKVKIASVTGYTNSREWNKYTSQKSSAVNLLEGSKYYIEILHKEGDQNDNLAVGWLKPGQRGSVPSEVVPGYVLSPYIDTTVPDAPTGLYANSIYSTQVGLSWIDNSSNENGFKIERAQGVGPFSEIAVVPINSTTYLDNGLVASTLYRYRILAYNGAGNSAYSNTLICTTTVTSGPGTAIPVSLLSFAIYSSEQSLMKDRSVFSGGGAVGSNGYVEVGSNANVQGNLVSGGNIYLRNYAKVYGNVSANGAVTFQAGAEIFDGTWQDSASNAVVNFPVIPPITIGTKDTNALPGQVLELSPGMYKTLIVESSGKVKFRAGTYTFRTLIVRPDAEILYDMSMYENLEIFISNELELADRTKAKFTGTNTYSPAVRIYTTDPNIVRIGTQVQITGIIIAPLAEVQIYDGTQCDGALYARKVLIEAVATMESGVVDPNKDFDDDYVPTFSEYKLCTDPRDPLDYTAIGIPDNAMIDNTVGQTVNYDYSIFFTGYSRANSVKMTYASGSLTDPSSPVLFQIRNLPISAPEYNESDYIPIGRYLEPLYNTLNSGESISVAIPLPDNTIPGASYKVAIYRSGAWEELDGRIGEQAVYADVTGDLGPMILVQKPSQAVYYFDNSVYSNQQITRLQVDLMIKGSVTTADPPGTFTLTYTDYSVDPSGKNESILINFERLEDSTLVARGEYTFYGRVVVNSASVNISSPDSVTYTVSNVFDLDKGQSLLITNEKTVSGMKGNANIPDKLVFSYGGNNLAFEYTSLNGEGQIRKGSAGSYYYNYYLKDHLGSTRMVINDAGDITDAIMYQPYGTMEEVAGIATPGADPERERFTGKEFDREGEDAVNGVSGLNAYYFGARYLDADIGQWISCDPKHQFWSPYSYGGNGVNCINSVDDNGGWMALIRILSQRGPALLETPAMVPIIQNGERLSKMVAAIGDPTNPMFLPLPGKGATKSEWVGWAIGSGENALQFADEISMEIINSVQNAQQLFLSINLQFNNLIFLLSGIDFNRPLFNQPNPEVSVDWDNVDYSSTRGPVVGTDAEVN